VLLGYHVVFSIEPRKVLNKIGRILMKGRRHLQGFVTFPNPGLNFSELVTKRSNDLRRW
jgi:hypothetical protein